MLVPGCRNSKSPLPSNLSAPISSKTTRLSIRLATWKQRIDADLELGRHREILGELGCLAARHPLHEDLQAQFMIALYRAGRRTDALDAFRRLTGRPLR